LSTAVDEEDEGEGSWVCTSADTKRCMKPVWFNIQAAHNLALEADPAEAAAVLKYLLEYLDDIPPARVCSYWWNAVTDEAVPALRRAVELMEGDVAKAVRRYGKRTQSNLSAINALFADMNAGFQPLYEDWVNEWQDEWQADEAAREAAARTDDEEE
jgi:hypothetical protein